MGFLGWLASGALSPILDFGKSIIGIFAKKIDDATQEDIAIIRAQAELLRQKWFIALQAMFAIPLAIYYTKAHIDAAFHTGVTDHMTGEIATWDMWVMAFLFFHSWLVKK